MLVLMGVREGQSQGFVLGSASRRLFNAPVKYRNYVTSRSAQALQVSVMVLKLPDTPLYL